MRLESVYIKENFSEYLNGNEVEVVTELQEEKSLYPGDHVMVYKDTIAATSDLAVPKHQQSHYIGIEGTITDIGIRESENQSGRKIQVLKVKKL
ncbi:MAG: hypothetical protein ACOYXT_15800 [Bacteroidota bacterium]